MSTDAATVPENQLIAQLFANVAPRRAWAALGWGIALGAHLLAAGLALGEPRAKIVPLPALEVELTAPEPPPPVPVALPAPPEPPPLEPTPVSKAAAAAPPEPARVGALLTAKADPEPSKNADEPVDFTNDPNALGFGAGVVALGGKAEVGAAHAQLGGVPAATGTHGVAARPTGDELTPASDLSQKPSLGESDPCRGYFPSAASDDVASAAVLVTIGKTGAVSGVQLLSEAPPQQGFGAAARTCMASKHFSPGLDRNGNPTRTAIRVNIRFAR
jgi:hypothetical protein